MSDLIGGFIEKKKAESVFITLEDGEEVVVKKLKDIKLITKVGFSGEEKEVIRLVCEVDTQEGVREKTFDNGTQRFAKELQDNGVKIGCGFTILRTGEQTKTRYTISDVIGGDTPVEPKKTETPEETPGK